MRRLKNRWRAIKGKKGIIIPESWPSSPVKSVGPLRIEKAQEDLFASLKRRYNERIIKYNIYKIPVTTGARGTRGSIGRTPRSAQGRILMAKCACSGRE